MGKAGRRQNKLDDSCNANANANANAKADRRTRTPNWPKTVINPCNGRHIILTNAALISVFCLILPARSLAAGIDCSKAENRIDHAICDNPVIRTQDSTMAKLAATILRNTATPELAKQFILQQRIWLKTRNAACIGVTTCLLSAYQARNLALTVITDRIGTAPLTDIQPVIMAGAWSAPSAVAMISAADNPSHKPFDPSLDGNGDPDKTITFSAYDYPQNGLPLPGSKIISNPDGKVCFKGQDYAIAYAAVTDTIKANYCVRYGWIKTNVARLAQDAPDPTRPEVPSSPGTPTPPLIPDHIGFLGSVAPAVFEHDLGIGPDAPAYIGFVRQRGDIYPGGYGPPEPTTVLIQGHDGALYAAVMLDTTMAPNYITTIGYQKWLPISADAGMKVLPLTVPGA